MGQIIRILGVAAATLVLSLPGAAQGGILTNQDVITLAGAGFSEAFLLDTIMGSQTQFDTNSAALADLAKHAISERVIRVMMKQSAVAEGVLRSPESVPIVMPSPNGMAMPKPAKVLSRIPSPTAMAVQSGTPFYEWKSVFWGLWRKRVGIAPTAAPQRPVVQHLGPMYQDAHAPQQQYVRAYPYEPLTYYMVAPR